MGPKTGARHDYRSLSLVDGSEKKTAPIAQSVSAGIVLFTFGIVLILFRRGFGLDIPIPFNWFW